MALRLGRVQGKGSMRGDSLPLSPCQSLQVSEVEWLVVLKSKWSVHMSSLRRV